MNVVWGWLPRVGLRLAVAGGLTLFALLAGMPTASAHAQLVASTPSEGAVLEQAPATIELEFNESVTARAGETKVFTGDGAEVAVEVATADRTVTITPTAALPEGTVVVGWAVTSADGHPIEGSLTFAVGDPTPGADGNEAFAEPVTAGIGTAHVTALVVAGLAGVALVVLLLLGRTGRWLESAWLVGLAAVVLAVPLAAVDRGGLGWAALRDWHNWIDGWLSWRGLLFVVAVLAAAAAVTLVRRSARVPALLATVLLVAAVPAAYAAPGTPAVDRPVAGGSPTAQTEVGDHMVRMRLDSVTVGTTRFRLELLDADDEPVAPFRAPRVRATNESLAIDVAVQRESTGVWNGQVTLPEPGDWEVEVSVRLDEFDNPVATLPFRIGDRPASPGGSH